MTAEALILFADLVILFTLLVHLFYSEDKPQKEKREFKKTVCDAFFGGKETEISEEEKRDREILEMIERYDGKSVRKEDYDD